MHLRIMHIFYKHHSRLSMNLRELSQPHKDALVLELDVNNLRVQRILINSGSVVDLMHPQV